MVSPVAWRDTEPFSLERARGLGLEHAEVAATIRDTLAWHDAHGEATAGLDEDAEAELLRAWVAALGPPCRMAIRKPSQERRPRRG